MSNPKSAAPASTAQASPEAKTVSGPTTAVSSTPSPSPKFDPTTAEVVKLLTLPLIKLRAGITVYIKPVEPMFQAKPQKNAKPAEGEADKKPPTLMHVVDLETGELAQIIPGSILADIFNDDYPNNGYVGKGFRITVGEQKAVQGGGGKRYNQYTVAEIKLPS